MVNLHKNGYSREQRRVSTTILGTCYAYVIEIERKKQFPGISKQRTYTFEKSTISMSLNITNEYILSVVSSPRMLIWNKSFSALMKLHFRGGERNEPL